VSATLVPTGLTCQDQVTADVRVDCAAVIVGSGAGGATMAAELADAGVDVVVVEEGGYHPTESFTAETGRSVRTLYRDGGLGLALGRPPVLFSEGRCVGGSTVVNGGMSWRTPARVLDRWAREEDVAAITEQDMEPHFAKVESRISVALQDPETIGRDMQLLKAGADAKGWTIIPNLRNQLHCAGTNNCTNGCPTGAKRSMLVTKYPARARARGTVVRGLPGGPDHEVRKGGDGRRGPVCPARGSQRTPSDGALRRGGGCWRCGADSRPAGPLGIAVKFRAARPQPQPSPERQGGRLLR